MNDILAISKTTLIFELDGTRSNKAIDRLELTNVDSQKRVGYKVKSTNVARYLVNPSSGILEPLQKIKIDIVLTVNANEDVSRMNDKFRLYCLEIDDESVTRQNIDTYIRRNEQNIKKVSINVKINEKYDKTAPLRTTTTAELVESMQPTDNKEAFNNGEQNSLMLDTSALGNVPSFTFNANDSKISNTSAINTNLESLLIEKENDINKLKETNSALQKDIAALRGKIVPSEADKGLKKKLRIDLWKIIVIFFIGLLLGVLLNKNSQTMEIVSLIEA